MIDPMDRETETSFPSLGCLWDSVGGRKETIRYNYQVINTKQKCIHVVSVQ